MCNINSAAIQKHNSLVSDNRELLRQRSKILDQQTNTPKKAPERHIETELKLNQLQDSHNTRWQKQNRKLSNSVQKDAKIQDVKKFKTPLAIYNSRLDQWKDSQKSSFRKNNSDYRKILGLNEYQTNQRLGKINQNVDSPITMQLSTDSLQHPWFLTHEKYNGPDTGTGLWKARDKENSFTSQMKNMQTLETAPLRISESLARFQTSINMSQLEPYRKYFTTYPGGYRRNNIVWGSTSQKHRPKTQFAR